MAPISHWMIYARTPFGMRRHRRSKRNGASVAVPANDGFAKKVARVSNDIVNRTSSLAKNPRVNWEQRGRRGNIQQEEALISGTQGEKHSFDAEPSSLMTRYRRTLALSTEEDPVHITQSVHPIPRPLYGCPQEAARRRPLKQPSIAPAALHPSSQLSAIVTHPSMSILCIATPLHLENILTRSPPQSNPTTRRIYTVPLRTFARLRDSL